MIWSGGWPAIGSQSWKFWRQKIQVGQIAFFSNRESGQTCLEDCSKFLQIFLFFQASILKVWVWTFQRNDFYRILSGGSPVMCCQSWSKSMNQPNPSLYTRGCQFFSNRESSRFRLKQLTRTLVDLREWPKTIFEVYKLPRNGEKRFQKSWQRSILHYD